MMYEIIYVVPNDDRFFNEDVQHVKRVTLSDGQAHVAIPANATVVHVQAQPPSSPHITDYP